MSANRQANGGSTSAERLTEAIDSISTDGSSRSRKSFRQAMVNHPEKHRDKWHVVFYDLEDDDSLKEPVEA